MIVRLATDQRLVVIRQYRHERRPSPGRGSTERDGSTITSMETIGALMAARSGLQ
jgi:hypothetical protein